MQAWYGRYKTKTEAPNDELPTEFKFLLIPKLSDSFRRLHQPFAVWALAKSLDIPPVFPHFLQTPEHRGVGTSHPAEPLNLGDNEMALRVTLSTATPPGCAYRWNDNCPKKSCHYYVPGGYVIGSERVRRVSRNWNDLALLTFAQLHVRRVMTSTTSVGV